jgi:hypothetical protein
VQGKLVVVSVNTLHKHLADPAMRFQKVSRAHVRSGFTFMLLGAFVDKSQRANTLWLINIGWKQFARAHVFDVCCRDRGVVSYLCTDRRMTNRNTTLVRVSYDATHVNAAHRTCVVSSAYHAHASRLAQTLAQLRLLVTPSRPVITWCVRVSV